MKNTPLSSFYLLSPSFSLCFLSLCIPPPFVAPYRPFISDRTILFHRRFSRSTQVRRFYLRHRNSSFLHIYYLTPELGAGFCMYYVWLVTYSLSLSLFSPRYLFFQRKRKNKEKESTGQKSCIRAIVLFFCSIFLM